ncbi:hypothetical protein E2C01_067783 [Portunus trituberculatus]|uniref:Uncharacterized protein n=1 Tax=Portunus trituberculatus TaxID=210409 RepID=A0A5B7HYC0_PORTR|nr:hypothetical protein [Portunus trituberculatus]
MVREQSVSEYESITQCFTPLTHSHQGPHNILPKRSSSLESESLGGEEGKKSQPSKPCRSTCPSEPRMTAPLCRLPSDICFHSPPVQSDTIL